MTKQCTGKTEIKIRLTQENREKINLIRYKTDLSFNAQINRYIEDISVEKIVQEHLENKQDHG